jgi:prepilin-type processing-associated H-X9-DG protein
LISRRIHASFTLVELMVILAIIGVLMGMVLAALQRVRDAANRARCCNNLRQIGLGIHHYHDAHRAFPPGVSYRKGADPHPFMSWSTRLLPFVEQQGVWMQALSAFAQDRRFLHNPPHVGLATVMPIYTCPADGRTLTLGNVGFKVAFTAYLGVEGTDQFSEDGLLYLDSRVRLADVTDGTSNTLCVGERPPSANGVLGWWYAGEGQSKDGSCDMVLGVRELNVSGYGARCSQGPYAFGPGKVSNQCDAFHFWSLHGPGAHFLFADGSVRFLGYSASPIMPALASRAGGEAVELP